jgi:predicted ArsR family transcriptional regulator
MQHSKGPGGRVVDLTVLRELDELDPVPVSARELADRLTLPAGSIASKLRSLVKAELVQINWAHEPGATRTYAITDAGRQYLLSAA